MHTIVCRLSLCLFLLIAPLAWADQTLYTVDTLLPDDEGTLVMGSTELRDFHPTTTDWVGGSAATANNVAVYTVIPQARVPLTCPQAPASTVNGINGARAIVGSCPHNGTEVAFLRSPTGQVTTLLPPGTSMARALGLNDGRVVVGFARNASTGRFQPLYYRTDTQRFADFPFPFPNVTAALLNDVNVHEGVIGIFSQNEGPWQGFYYRNKVWTLLTCPGGSATSETFPLSINDAAQIVGICADLNLGSFPFLWDQGQFFTVAIQGAEATEVSSIANDGRVGGTVVYRDASTQQARFNGFLWREAPWAPLTASLTVAMARSTVMAMGARPMSSTPARCQADGSLGGKLQGLPSSLCTAQR